MLSDVMGADTCHHNGGWWRVSCKIKKKDHHQTRRRIMAFVTINISWPEVSYVNLDVWILCCNAITSRVACFHTFAHLSNVLAVVALRVIGVSVRCTHVVGAGVGINVRAGDGVCRSALHSHGSQVGHILTAVNLQMRTESLKNERCRSEENA